MIKKYILLFSILGLSTTTLYASKYCTNSWWSKSSYSFSKGLSYLKKAKANKEKIYDTYIEMVESDKKSRKLFNLSITNFENAKNRFEKIGRSCNDNAATKNADASSTNISLAEKLLSEVSTPSENLNSFFEILSRLSGDLKNYEMLDLAYEKEEDKEEIELFNDHKKVVLYLLKQGVSIKDYNSDVISNFNGINIITGVDGNYLKNTIVSILIDLGVDINVDKGYSTDMFGKLSNRKKSVQTPIVSSMLYYDFPTFKLLFSKGADLTKLDSVQELLQQNFNTKKVCSILDLAYVLNNRAEGHNNIRNTGLILDLLKRENVPSPCYSEKQKLANAKIEVSREKEKKISEVENELIKQKEINKKLIERIIKADTQERVTAFNKNNPGEKNLRLYLDYYDNGQIKREYTEYDDSNNRETNINYYENGQIKSQLKRSEDEEYCTTYRGSCFVEKYYNKNNELIRQEINNGIGHYGTFVDTIKTYENNLIVSECTLTYVSGYYEAEENSTLSNCKIFKNGKHSKSIETFYKGEFDKIIYDAKGNIISREKDKEIKKPLKEIEVKKTKKVENTSTKSQEDTSNYKKMIFLDKATGLMWQDRPGSEKNAMTWQDAVNYCQDLSLEGHNDWRLPSRYELETIFEENKQDYLKLSLIEGFQYITIQSAYRDPWFYWSSTTVPSDTSSARGFTFYNDPQFSAGEKRDLHHVRCVRTTKHRPITYEVIKIRSDDTLSVRKGAGTDNKKKGDLAYNAKNIKVIRCKNAPNGNKWCKILYMSNGDSIRGWVSAKYIKSKESSPDKSNNNSDTNKYSKKVSNTKINDKPNKVKNKKQITNSQKVKILRSIKTAMADIMDSYKAEKVLRRYVLSCDISFLKIIIKYTEKEWKDMLINGEFSNELKRICPNSKKIIKLEYLEPINLFFQEYAVDSGNILNYD